MVTVWSDGEFVESMCCDSYTKTKHNPQQKADPFKIPLCKFGGYTDASGNKLGAMAKIYIRFKIGPLVFPKEGGDNPGFPVYLENMNVTYCEWDHAGQWTTKVDKETWGTDGAGTVRVSHVLLAALVALLLINSC